MASDPALLFVSTYPPTRCGLATFSKSLLGAIADTRGSRAGLGVAAVGSPSLDYPAEVVTHLHPDAGLRLPRRLSSTFDVIVLQHEFGIFGPDDGIRVLDLATSADLPVIAVLHTVLAEPSKRQRYIIETLAEHCAGLVVMSEAARQRLENNYNLAGCPVETIPHGAVVASQAPQIERLRPMVLSWGLLGPGKGLESGIRAMRRLRHLMPAPLYIIAGQTHPNVLKSQGESYRNGLAALAAELGVADMVHFVNRYLTAEDLVQLRSQASVALLPYENKVQVTSGALVEAIGAGLPVVATRFPHAVELLTGGAGELVEHGDAGGIAHSLESLLIDPARRLAAGRAINGLKPHLSWAAVGAAYQRLFAAAAAEVGAA
jgi:glycosyltransferase involved in cell wall biosynthesis